MMGLLAGCADVEEPKDVEEFVGADLVFAVPETGVARGLSVSETRGSDDVALEDVVIIPFKTQGEIGREDEPCQHLDYSVWNAYEKKNARFYYNRRCQFVTGVASVLVYGVGRQGDKEPGKQEETTAVIPTTLAPSDIAFMPTQIRPTTERDEKAEALADYLTRIAATPGWNTTTDVKLHALYENYIGKKDGTVDYQLFAGSSTSILGYISELYTEAGKYETDGDLAKAIRERIAEGATVTDGSVTALTAALTGYPGNIGLPDGAAAMQWIGGEERFVAQTTTTTIAPITSVTRFAYPAELYFYGNSRISTSASAVNTTSYETETTWSGVLQNYKANGIVDRTTQSVAVNTPLQYGMARLTTTLKGTPETLTDADGEKWKVESGKWTEILPVTGVIVGGQYPVGFDFRPETYSEKPKEADMRYVYDQTVTDGTTNTYVLQSYENGKVTVVLELENRLGRKFRSKDGVVYPGAKFYLVGYVDPTIKTGQDDYTKRVFTQDYVTTLEMTVSEKALANAYSVMPDLLAARMEIGVLLVPKWNVIMPTNVELF
jgi:hypothetical protein